MPVTVAMYDKGLAHIGKRLEALGLDIDVMTFDRTGQYQIGGSNVRPGEVAVDYMWLNSALNADNFREGAFELALATKSIGVLQTFNAGLDDPFYGQLARKGSRICNSSAQAIAISEFVMAHVLSLNHPMEQQREQQAKRIWKTTPYREISQTNWLIVGYGPIGQEIAKRVKAFGAGTAVVRRSRATSHNADKTGTMNDLNAFAKGADVVVLACPLNDETRGKVDATFFAALKPGAILVNIARGPLIDDTAMLAALEGESVKAAVLDVFGEEPLPTEHPFWGHPKVRLTPHTSFAGSGVRGRWDQLFLDNIARYLKGETLINEVDPRDLR